MDPELNTEQEEIRDISNRKEVNTQRGEKDMLGRYLETGKEGGRV